ncbi:acetaldehyde dehydrogenase, partial [Clostridium botulinum CFSAN001627]
MENFDKDLRSIQQARDLARLGKVAADKIADYTEEQIDKILRNMV